MRIKLVLGFWLLGIALAWWAVAPSGAGLVPAASGVGGGAAWWAARQEMIYLSGLWSVGLMVLAMLLALRLPWMERTLGGMDKVYRLHKWPGIAAAPTAVLHWGAKESVGIRKAQPAAKPWMPMPAPSAPGGCTANRLPCVNPPRRRSTMKHPYPLRTALLALALGLATLPTWADDDCDAPVARWQSREAVRQMAAQQGWDVQRLKIDDGCYEVYGKDAQGRSFKAKVDPETLRVVKIKHREHDREGERARSREREHEREHRADRAAPPASDGAAPVPAPATSPVFTPGTAPRGQVE